MQTGTVVNFSAPKGWGFLSPDKGGPDVFVHHTNIEMDGYRKLDRGDRVSFDIEDGPNGKPQAVRVTVIEKAVEV